jgi:hypothetical protein
MHGRNACAHKHAADNRLDRLQLRTRHHDERDPGSGYSCQQGREDRRPVIAHRDRQTERQHGDVVHGPNTQAHDRRATGQP